MLRFCGLLFGIPILLLGTICIGTALAGVIGNAINKDYQATGMPLALYGLPFVWLGYRLVFTKPVKPSLTRFKRSSDSN